MTHLSTRVGATLVWSPVLEKLRIVCRAGRHKAGPYDRRPQASCLSVVASSARAERVASLSWDSGMLKLPDFFHVGNTVSPNDRQVPFISEVLLETGL